MGVNETWSVSVERNGDLVVSIGSGGMSGRDISAADEAAIRTAATHLLSFIGDRPTAPSADLTALVEKWRREMVTFPRHDQGRAAAAAVSLCADELVAALRAAKGEK